jgi:Family of unknown function (DUF6502)
VQESRLPLEGSSEKFALTRMAIDIFGPLCELFVRFGMTSPEAESLLRSVLVHAVASRTDRDIPMTLSRAALLSGVHRNEVRRILETPPGIDSGREMRCHRANRVLAAWHNDPKYTDAKGRPKDLDIKPEKKRPQKKQQKRQQKRQYQKKDRVHFWDLAQQYAPGVWPKLILDELDRIGAVRKLKNGKLHVCRQSYAPSEAHEGFEHVGLQIRDFLLAAIHNWPEPSSTDSQ